MTRKVFSHPLVLSWLIVALLIAFNAFGWLGAPQDFFYRLTAPLSKAVYRFSAKASGFLKTVGSIEELNQTISSLKQENERLLAKLAQLQEAAKENQLLREQIGVSQPKFEHLVLASVVGQDFSGLGKYILIDKGQKEGLREKSVVIVAGNLLIGQVVETTNSFAKVQLITDPNSRVNARLQKSGLKGLVRGAQGGDLLIDLLPQGRTIEQGQLVVTSGLAGVFPAGLLIGRIKEVISSEAQISQKAKITPVLDFSNLEKVFVIIGF